VFGRERLIHSARLAGDYLLRMQKSDGSFHYWYDPASDSFPARAYNILRHTGAGVSLIALYETTHEAKYLIAARKSATFLRTRFRPGPRGASYVLDFDGKAKLGANGLALILLARLHRHEPDATMLRQVKELAKMVIELQNSDGSFQSYYRIQGTEPAGSTSLYYPGEAMLGLVESYKLTHDALLLQSVRKGADYLVASQRAARELPPDAWLVQALEALYAIGHEKRYAEHAVDLSERMIPGGEAAGSEEQDSLDASELRSAQVASRAEGMLAGYRLARAIGDIRAGALGRALTTSAALQISQQYDEGDGSDVRRPRAIGGFRQSEASPLIRIDFVQHNISALLGVAETLFPVQRLP